MTLIKKLLISAATIGLLSSNIYASEQFGTSYDVTYDISADGETNINQKIGITNKQDDVIATQYELKIKEIDIYDISAKDPSGSLEVDTKVDGTTTTLNTEFNEQVIGKDRTLNWELNYKSDDIAKKVGSVWNIHIPKVETLQSTENYKITLKVPKNFGPKIFVSPSPAKSDENKNEFIYEFNKQTLSKEGVNGAFGTYQTLNFQLQYKLENNSSITSYQEIALPPNIQRKQQVFYKKIDPKPTEVTEDKDGNLLLKYKVPPKEVLSITALGEVKISGNQINPSAGGKMSDLPKKLVKSYTKKQEYWEIDSPQIKQIASSLYDPNLTVSENAQKAYDYVVQNFEYDFDISEKTFVDRSGAQKAISNPRPWACMEFTDSFIALTRAMGIPARELNGYAFNQQEESITNPLSINFEGGDLLHSWAEFYDPKYGWVQVDPTWGNTSKIDYFTKLDTNHFVFVRKGLDSTYPYPAGAYKVEGNEKQIQIGVVEDAPSNNFEPNIKFYKTRNFNILQLFKKTEKYILLNDAEDGTTQIYNINDTKRNLLPYQTKKFYIDRDEKQITYRDFNGTEKTLRISTEDKKLPNETSNKTIYLGVLLGLVLCGMLYSLVIFPKFRKKLLRPLRNLLRDLGR